MLIMNKKINLLNRVSNLLFSTDSVILLLTIIRKLSFFFAFIWEFTDYHEHYAAYLIFALVWLICNLTCQLLKENRINYHQEPNLR